MGDRRSRAGLLFGGFPSLVSVRSYNQGVPTLKFPLAEWQAQQARLSVFPMPDATTRSTDWWLEVTGGQPDETKTNPKQGSGLVQGEFDPGMLILKLEPDRIDWVLAPQERDLDEQVANPEIPILGPITGTVDAFSAIAEKWLAREDLPAIARIAFGAVLVHSEKDRRAGYLRLPSYIPVLIDPASSDFLYQVNLPPVPSETGIDGLQLNRLSKWSVASIKTFSFRFTGTAVRTQPAPEAFALRLEVDINTAPAFAGPIPRARLVELYRELVRIGRNIATDGLIQ